jgi:hypothetical protein
LYAAAAPFIPIDAAAQLLTLILRAFDSSVLGSLIVKAPSSYSAETSLSATVHGNVTDRQNGMRCAATAHRRANRRAWLIQLDFIFPNIQLTLERICMV